MVINVYKWNWIKNHNHFLSLSIYNLIFIIKFLSLAETSLNSKISFIFFSDIFNFVSSYVSLLMASIRFSSLFTLPPINVYIFDSLDDLGLTTNNLLSLIKAIVTTSIILFPLI